MRYYSPSRRLRWVITASVLACTAFAAAEQASLVADLYPGSRSDLGLGPYWLTAAGSSVYFVGRTVDLGTELWQTDGTAGGTRLTLDIMPGWYDSDPAFFVDLDGVLLFSANDLVNGRELWQVRVDQPPRAPTGRRSPAP